MFVSYCYRYLLNEIDRLAALDCKGKGFAYSNAFRRGAVSAISARLTQARKEVAASTSTALVVLRKADEAVADYVKAKFKTLVTKKASAVDARGYAHGKAVGEKIAIPGKDQRPSLGAEPRKLRA